MGVDGGAGNAISLSEIQSFYGGSNPISLSEYYRNGSLVPGDQVTSQSDTNGTTSQTIGQFSVAVSSAFNGSLSSASNVGFPGSVTVAANTAVITPINIHEDKDGDQSSLTVTILVNGSSIGSFTTEDNTGNGAGLVPGRIRGPAAFGAGSGTILATLSAGDVVSFSHSGNYGSAPGFVSQVQTRPETFDVSFTNNNATTITLSSGSTGGAQSYTQSQTRQVKDDSSTANYTLGYAAVLGNTNVPAGGTINMDVFNAPGTATP